ncbi:MAG: PolC-type DNA polymerase III, partial [Bacilli bacterium]|nr:PolC-type DNA polymerase III [Bacilli bacterium]
TAEEKRVELHCHTKMSQMDGVADECDVIKQAMKFGMKAVAITDHNGVQGFPHVFNMVTGYNKKLEEGQEPFKAIYGTELVMIDDEVNIVIRPNEDNMLDQTYVVFDFETTGFNAGGADSIIEIGAVKIKDGMIIEKYDELINPGRPLPQKIIEVTNITDAMLEEKDNEENAVKRFVEWFGDCPMVAHNAKFDVSFLEMAYNKYNLGTFKNPVIDTLELSRTLDNTYARHSLSALVKRYEVPWDESAHHRGDYDAEGTALVFYKMLKKLSNRNIDRMCDLDKLVSKDEIHKYGRAHHVNLLVKNKTGLKNLFTLVSLANTTYLYKTPRILRSVINEYREGILVGSGCYESEVFREAKSKSDDELSNIIRFYDYVEVQPIDCYDHLVQSGDFGTKVEVAANIEKVVRVTEEAGKIIVATGDVHHLKKDDKIYREIIVNQKVPGGGRHPLARNGIKEIPSNHFRTTNEMLEDFKFLGEEQAYKIVVENTNKIANMCEIVEVIPDTGGIPFSPRVKSDDGKEYLDCPVVVTDLVYTKAAAWYGDPLPYSIEERISTELYGDIVFKIIKEKHEGQNLSDEEYQKIVHKELHDEILKGSENIKQIVTEYVKKNDEEGLDEQALAKKVKKTLGGVIGGGFDPIYLISQRLVKHSNDEGYLVGSRGSVGSSFVATMMGITEVNPLAAHYRCSECKLSIFDDEEGNPLGAEYSSGFDLPDKECPNCHIPLIKDGQDMPFATFLGFNADKVPDIDLNFSDLNQASAHAYTKVLFGEDNVYRAGTIGTVADKTAFGFVKGYCEEKEKGDMRTAEVERLAMGCTGVKRTTGQHPGGIVVIPDYKDVADFTPFQFPAEDATAEWRTTHFDYHSIDQCLLKLDILGHSDPTQLRLIQNQSGTDIMKVPLDDKATMSIFTSTEALGVTKEQIMCNTGTLGIPEFGTPFTIKLVEDTKPTTFAELIKISGLSHGTDVWLGNAQELIANNIVPFKETIGCRDDIMVYLMYHGLAPIKSFKIMEFVRKGKASKEPDTWKEHVKTMEEANIPDWFIGSCAKIKYMFPKAHAAAYVISAFRIAWYKVHMPVYFYASWYSSKATDVDVENMIKGYQSIKARIEDIQAKGYEATNKENGQAESLKVALEATARGIKFLNVDLYESDATVWIAKNDTEIYPPFNAIDGLGDTVAKNIVAEREKGNFISVEDVQKRAKVSQTLIDKMKEMGILSGMPDSNQLSLF